ncbi:glycosyltransferase [Mesorhizobium sp. M1378]|uniref:glycosyltransferase n=1 Tax=Mesorhizobium sp. M1378 TaxID=2957092 RepID=UPI0033366B0D
MRERSQTRVGRSEEVSVAVVSGSLSRLAGGLFNSVRQSALALHSLGCRISVLGTADVHTAKDIGAWAPIRPLAAKPASPLALGYAPALGDALRNGDFNLVHQHGIWKAMSAQVSAWRKRTGGPVMISPRGMLDPWAMKNSAWKKRVAGFLYENSNLASSACLHALSYSEADSMRAFGLNNPIAIIPNGVIIPADVHGPGALRPPWLPTDGRRVLLFLGRIHPKKGVLELVDAWAKLKREAPEIAASWRLVIAGWDDGGHEPRLRAALARHDLERDVLLPGPLFDDEKDATLRHADAFILPSHSEGLPMSVLEAWAYRLPVLMTEACNLPEGFASGAAIKVDLAADRLSLDVASALAKPDLRSRGEKGRRLVEDRFTWGKIAQQHLATYQWMLDGGDPPGHVTQS